MSKHSVTVRHQAFVPCVFKRFITNHFDCVSVDVFFLPDEKFDFDVSLSPAR